MIPEDDAHLASVGMHIGRTLKLAPSCRADHQKRVAMHDVYDDLESEVKSR